ncbi:hypothetical protein ACQKWADRAFT_276567 [Trichoderma austrokoningii]
MFDHIRMHPHCGVCGFAFTARDEVVTLTQEGEAATTISSPTIKYEHAVDSIADDTGGRLYLYCRFSGCELCASSKSAPTVTIHTECVAFSAQIASSSEDRLLSWLWTIATWRSPWIGAPHLYKALSPVVDAGQFMLRAARACEMPGLALLPKELALMICDQSDQSRLHRCLSLWTYALWCNLGYHKSPKTIPIREIEEWQRGSHPVMMMMSKGARQGQVESDVQKPIIILCIDSQGLRSITRVQKGYYSTDTTTTSANDTALYVVEAAECFASTQVEYSYPFARLQLRPEGGFRIWDTPSPPQWQECILDADYDPAARTRSHLSTIDTRSITGLTFFTCFAQVWGVHAHTKRQPFARSTFDELSPTTQAFAHWVHVPLGSKDTITAFGWSRTYHNARFYLRLKLAGDIVLGSTYRINKENVKLIQHPLTLIYESPAGEVVSFVGGHATAEQRDDAEVEDFVPTFQYRKHPFRSASYSSAPLGNVIRAQVFYKRRASAPECRGIVLEYRNGSTRALGQCRLGVDLSEECFEPAQLCYSSLGNNSVQVKVYSNGDLHAGHDDEEADWTCCLMRGVLEFWFSETDAKINWKQEQYII